MDERGATAQELIQLTEKFIALADELFEANKITHEEYSQLTYTKKDFLRTVIREENRV